MAWQPASLSAWLAPYRSTADPYLLIADATGFVDHGGRGDAAKLLGVEIQWDGQDASTAPAALRAIFAGDPRSRLCESHVDAGMQFATADVSGETLERLIESTRPAFRINLTESLQAMRIARRSKLAPAVVRGPSPGAGTLLLGIVDHGCPFAHREFRASSLTTRVHALWDQDPNPDFVGAGGSPLGFRYGNSLTNEELNAFMAGGSVDEDACYARADYSPMRQRVSHGAHVLGLLTGVTPSPSLVYGRPRDTPLDAAGQAPIVFVQLPRNVLQAPYGPSIERAIVDGIQYVLDHACSGMRVVIAVAYGQYLGPHDGNSWAEEAICSQARQARRRGIELHLVFPTGNGREDGTHVELDSLKSGHGAEVAWHVPLDNAVPTHAEAWFRVPLEELITEVWSPTAPGAHLSIDRAGVWVWPGIASPACVVVAQNVPGRGSHVLLRVAPTAGEPSRPTAPPGRWGIRVTPAAGKEMPKADVYAAFGHGNLGIPTRSHQPFLVPIHQSRLAGDEMLIGTGCGNENWMIGGYVRRTGQPARYAARGPSRGGLRVAFNADALAITDESPSLGGVVGIANRSGAGFRLSGTSVAVPQAARELAQFGQLHPRVQSDTNTPPAVRRSPGPLGSEAPNVDRFLDYYWSP